MQRLLSVFVSFLACMAILSAQGTDLGTIRGTVNDSSGAVVPGATVTVTDTATKLSRRVITGDAGTYEASALRSGSYKVSATAPGFGTTEVVNIALTPGGVVRADATLKPAAAAQTIEITSEAPLIQTENQTITQTLNNFVVNELPRDSRDIYSFLYLNPNITQGDSSDSNAFKFIGAQTYGASFSLDGQRSNGGIFGQPTASQPSLEAVGEISIMSNDFTAEYAGVANVRIETARGGDQYHGSAFYNNKNAALAAWDLNQKIAQSQFLPTPAQSSYPNPYFNLNEFGGSFSGPVPKLKNTYFMFAYEKRFSRSPTLTESTSMPGPLLTQGDFSQLSDSAKPRVPAGVTLTPEEIAGDTVGGLGQRLVRIPQRLMNPVTSKLVSLYFPSISASQPINPTSGRLSDFFASEPGKSDRDLGTVRIDHTFNERNQLSAVYNISNWDIDNAYVQAPYTGLGLRPTDMSTHTLSLSYTHLFTTSLVNELRGGFNIQDRYTHANQTTSQFLTSIGFDQSDIQAYGALVGQSVLNTYGNLAVTIGNSKGFASFGNGGRSVDRNQNQDLSTYGDTLSWMHGAHTFKAGIDLVRNVAEDGFVANRGNPRGLLTYTGTGPDAMARFLMGLPANTASYVSATRPAMNVQNWEQGYFVQDDWKVNSRVTVNAGVRYEIITPFTEANDLILNFDPNYVGPDGQKGRFVVPSKKTLPYIDNRIIQYGVVTADQIGLPRSLVKTDWTKIAPRAGVAWRVTDKSVVRGGYGWYFPTSAAQGMRDAMASSPFNQGVSSGSTAAASLQPWPGFVHGVNPLAGGTPRLSGGLLSFNAIPFDLKEPRIDQFNATFEHELGANMSVRASYLGTRMHNLIAGRDLNMIPPNNAPFGTSTGDGVTACDPVNNGDCDYSDADRARLPYPAFGDDIASYGNYGHAAMNAAQFEVKRRFSGGLLFDAFYTYLHQTTSSLDTANSTLGGTVYNQFNPDRDYSFDSFVPKHRFVFYSVAELPFGNGKRFGSNWGGLTNALAGGWETTWQLFIKSGTGFTPFWYCDDCGPIAPGNIASTFIDAVGDFNGTSYRPLVVSNPNVRQGDQMFDPNAFAVPTVGADALDNPQVIRRNVLWGPGTWGLNLGVHKKFHIGERFVADLGAEANNLMNHPLLSPDQGGADGQFMYLGDFNVTVDPNTLKLQPITDVTRNPNFGRLMASYPQDGVDSRRTIRLKLRITF